MELPKTRLAVLVPSPSGAVHEATVMECPAVHGEIRSYTCHDCWHTAALKECSACVLGHQRWGDRRAGKLGFHPHPPEAVTVDEKATARAAKRQPTLEDKVGTAASKLLTKTLRTKGATAAERRALIKKLKETR